MIHNSGQMFFVITNNWYKYCTTEKDDVKYVKKAEVLCIKSNDFRS